MQAGRANLALTFLCDKQYKSVNTALQTEQGSSCFLIGESLDVNRLKLSKQ